MLNGLKLLLADDSLAIQKVVDLTFSDEGMQVTTVGDGDRALEKLHEIAPDIVLADCFMPGIDGYELCRLIKTDERYKEIPVILLAGSFEPFNEAEARQVGANDVVTKPFQSIRQLISKVGSLLSNENTSHKPAHEYSTLGLGGAGEPAPDSAGDASMIDPNMKVMVEAPAPEPASMQDANVSVFVEAAPIPEHELEADGPSCDADVEAQTADTRQLERISDEDLRANSSNAEPGNAHDDTMEMEPVRQVASSFSYSEAVTTERAPETPAVTPHKSPDVFSDTLLDLGDTGQTSTRNSEEVILDLDFEEAAAAPVADLKVEPVASFSESQPTTRALTTEPLAEVAVAAARAHDWAIEPAAPPERVVPVATVEEEEAAPAAESTSAPAAAVDLNELSPETIDAIARRAVEQLSERVVREIAWEVVPELAELLIKQRLEEEK